MAALSIGIGMGPPIGIKKGPFDRRVLLVALAPSELAGVAAGCVIVVAAFKVPAVVAGLDDVTVMGQPVEQRGRHFGIENKQHPDYALAQDLARGFWASLPYLDTSLITSLLARARRIAKPDDFAALASTVDTEQFRAVLGRVACGYDGGQIIDE